MYVLIWVIAHRGNTKKGGHYVTYYFYEKRWWRLNDLRKVGERAERISDETFFKETYGGDPFETLNAEGETILVYQSAYMLGYAKKHGNPAEKV